MRSRHFYIYILFLQLIYTIIHLTHDDVTHVFLAGVRERGRGEGAASTAAPTTTTTQARPSTSSAGSVKKTIDKGRSLLRRASEGAEPAAPRRNLMQDMEDAGNGDDDQELLPDADYQHPPQAQTPRPDNSVAGEALAPDFWGQMDIMLNNKVGMFGAEVTNSMDLMEARIGTHIQAEREERQKNNADTNACIDEVLCRIGKLEMTEKKSGSERAGGQGGHGAWRPMYVVMGVWPKDTHRSVIEKCVEEIWKHMPHNLRAACQMPYVSRLYCRICKMKAAPESSSQHKQEGWPGWAAVERSPDTGNFRRRLKVAQYAIQQVQNLEMDESNGNIHWNKLIVARWDRDSRGMAAHSAVEREHQRRLGRPERGHEAEGVTDKKHARARRRQEGDRHRVLERQPRDAGGCFELHENGATVLDAFRGHPPKECDMIQMKG